MADKREPRIHLTRADAQAATSKARREAAARQPDPKHPERERKGKKKSLR